MLQLLSPRGDGVLVRNGLTLLGNAALGEQRLGAAVEALTAALAAGESAGPGWHRATSLLNLGTAQRASGEAAEAEKNLHAALAMYEDLGDRQFTARTLAQLGYLALEVSGPPRPSVRRNRRWRCLPASATSGPSPRAWRWWRRCARRVRRRSPSSWAPAPAASVRGSG